MVTTDTIALLLFSIATGGFTLLVEVKIAGLTLSQWAGIRILYNTTRFGGAYFLGKFTDLVRRRLLRTSESFIRRAVADTGSLWLYQFPLYVASAFVMGATLRQIAATSVMFTANSLLTGWIYGLILNAVRAYFIRTGED